jgi:hypothetical protein
MSSTVVLEAKGLNFQPNQLSALPGSLIEGSNIIIRRDNVAEKRRGFQLYGNSFGTGTDRAKQLLTYKATLLRQYEKYLQYDSDGEGTFLTFTFTAIYTYTVSSANATKGATYSNNGQTFTVSDTIAAQTTLITTGVSIYPPLPSGTLSLVSSPGGVSDSTITFSSFIQTGDDVEEAQVGLRTKSIESNGNLYFTSSEGIRKISATTSANLTQQPDYITKAGGVKAIDLTAQLIIPLGQQSGFLPQDSVVAYRTLWLTNDENNNLIQGTPSQPVQIYNSQLSLMLQDYINLVDQLDSLDTTGSIISYNQFVANYGLSASASASQLQTTLLALGAQLDFSIEYASDAAPTATVPLQITSITIDNANQLATVTFAGSPTLANYFFDGQNIYLTGTSSQPNSTPVPGFALTNTNYNLFDSSNAADYYTFTVTSANASEGAQYTQGSNTFYVTKTITGSTTLVATTLNTSTPTASGILTYSAGTGSPGTNDATITYSSFATPTVNAPISTTHSTITIPGHGFVTGQPVQLTAGSGGSLPTGLNVGTTYYIINPTANTIQLSSTATGTGFVSITAVGTDIATSIFVIPTPNVTINGPQVITNVGSNTIQFATKATGAVDIAGSKIISYQFETLNNTVGPNQTSSLAALIVSLPATNAELIVLQSSIQALITALQNQPEGVISSALITEFLSDLELTTTANIELNISIPQDAQNPNYFLQVYRSDIAIATQAEVLSSLIADDEMALVIEYFPTPDEIAAKQVNILDDTPVAFEGADLYTNAQSGEGIAQANDIPPFSLDINKFNGSVFYANTQTKQQLELSLLPVTGIIDDFNLGNNPSIMITNGIATNKYTFQLGVQELQQISADTYANTTDHGFIILYSTDNTFRYFFRLNKTPPSGNPAGFIPGTDILVDIDISSLSVTGTAAVMAAKLAGKINVQIQDFTTEIGSPTSNIEVTNASEGIVSPGSVNGLGGVAWGITVIIPGSGENAATNSVLLSNAISPSQQIDETARSLVRVINRNSNETVYAYYLSGTSTVPGQMLLEARDMNTPVFYILANDLNTGRSFSPDLSPNSAEILSFSNTTPNIALTSSAHGLKTGQQIVLFETGMTTTTPDLSGLQTVTIVPDTTHFEVSTPSLGTSTGVFLLATSAVFSNNQAKQNRVFYSKADQPEAVPIVNYFDIGALDKAIIRIIPLRDSLFVFKQDGLYRISGISIPFTVSLFDSSCIVEAPDSVAIANNVIYCWTSQGISTVTESGVKFNISRPIDTNILNKATKQYVNFSTATWGIGYESDNSYLVSTVVNTTDTEAQLTYRYSTLTNTWTSFDITAVCGVVNVIGDDKIYLGAGDTNFIEQERKDYLRTDYADRQFNITLSPSSYFGNMIKIPLTNISVGDVITQSPYITVYNYNALLQKLDNDPTVPTANFYSTIAISGGVDMHQALITLATKLDVELSSSSYVPLVGGSTDFLSIQSYYNAIINLLNIDPILSFQNYVLINDITTFEVIIDSINTVTSIVTLSLNLPFIQGMLTVYNSINSELTYSPITMGDALSLKHFRESTVMFENKAFTSATVSFATDLLPAFTDVPFFGDGSGIFGETTWFGNDFFGGASNSAPMRTLIPRNAQRCRYMVVKFNHNIARENISLFGITLTGDVTSTRGYR